MRLQVFRLRERGLRLPGSEVDARGPAEGVFLFRQRILRSPIYKAMLVRPDDMHNYYVVPLLDYAVIVEVKATGMLVSGREEVATGPRKHQCHEYKQSWWCVPSASE